MPSKKKSGQNCFGDVIDTVNTGYYFVSNKTWTKKHKNTPTSSFSSHSGKGSKGNKTKSYVNSKILDRSKKAISKNKPGTLVITPGTSNRNIPRKTQETVSKSPEGQKMSLTEQEMALFSSISPDKSRTHDSVGKPTNINQ